MRRFLACGLMAGLVAVSLAAQGRDPVLEVLRLQLDIENRVMATDVTNLERAQEQLSDAADRMVRLGDDLLRAQKEGEDSGALNARAMDARRAEAEVNELISTSQQLRSAIMARRSHVDQLAAEVKRLEEAAAVFADELSGRWQVNVEPGGMKGTFDLKLDGTLVQGIYQLSGGWKGSLRGTFIGGALRMERIDSQLGLVAVFHGRMSWRDGERRVEGFWEGTNLAAGMAASGSWVGRKDTK
jgi:hypothetical protein